MAASLIQFAKYVRPEVMGCSEIQILDAILRAAIVFCNKSRYIKETFNVPTVAGTNKYVLVNMPADVQAREIVNVKRGLYQDLDPSSFREFQNNNLNTLTGTPQYFYMDKDRKLVLGNIPVAIETLSVTAIVRPKETAATLPDTLFDEYVDEIAAGAKSRLMVMKGQPWTDIQQASIYRVLFNDAIDDSNTRESKGSTNKSLRMVGSYF